MNRRFWCLLLFLVLIHSAYSQTRYLVQFRDKGTNPFSLSSPNNFLSQRAIDRRTRYAIPIDSTDLPITPRYIDSLRLITNVTVLNGSRWLNSVSIQTSDASALAKINNFPFVQSVSSIAGKLLGSTREEKQRLMDDPVILHS